MDWLCKMASDMITNQYLYWYLSLTLILILISDGAFSNPMWNNIHFDTTFYLLMNWVFVIIQIRISVLLLIIPHLYTISPILKVNRRNWIFYPQIMNILFIFQGQTGGASLFLILILFRTHYFPFQVAWKFEI